MKGYKKRKEELIFLKEINSLIINAREIEKEYYLNNNNNINGNQGDENEKNNLTEDRKILERQKRSLKYILSNLEKNYGFNSPYHEELSDTLPKKNDMNEEISNNIINLYSTKQFNLCYNLWRKYDFQLLLGINEERNFDMLNYLNKLRDRYERRIDQINKIKEINANSNNNKKENNSNNINNQYQTDNSKLNSQNNSHLQQYSQMSNSDLYNLKLSENEKLLQTLKRRVKNIKTNKNFNK